MASPSDKAVLNLILHPFWPEGANDNEEVRLTDDVNQSDENLAPIREREKLAVSLADQGRLDEALSVLSDAIELKPKLPSLFNNRAQVHRLMKNDDSAFQDLNDAIEFSGGIGKSACQAFCQRGLLKIKSGDNQGATDDFKAAAELGSTFAKMQLVHLNPYAALCNQMVSQIMSRIKSGP